VSERNKATVRRLIAEVLNGGRLDVIDELYAAELAVGARRWIAPFRASFPDVHMEVVELIAEDDKVVGRFRCSATHLGSGSGMRRPDVASSASTRSPSSGSATAGSPMRGAWRTASRGCASSAWRARQASDQASAGSRRRVTSSSTPPTASSTPPATADRPDGAPL
jgi:hypothetical protein